MSETLQYTIVGVIILIAIIWIGVKASHIGKDKKSGCCGCALSDACKRKENKPDKNQHCDDRVPPT